MGGWLTYNGFSVQASFPYWVLTVLSERYTEFLALLDRIPTSPTLLSVSGKENPDSGWLQTGGNPDSRQNSSVLSSTPLPWLDGSMEGKNTGLLWFASLCRNAMGLTVWESNLGKKDPRVLFMLSMWFVWLSVTQCAGNTESNRLPHHTYATTYREEVVEEKEEEGKGKVRTFNSVLSDFCFVVGLLTDAAWQGVAGREGSVSGARGGRWGGEGAGVRGREQM